MARQLQVGHQLLPVCNLGWTPEQWRTARDAVYRDAVFTTSLCRDDRMNLALGLLASIQHKLAQLLEQPPTELHCDSIRHLVTALRRAGELEQASELIAMFNTTPGYLAP